MAPGVAAPTDAARSTPPHATQDQSLHDPASRSAPGARLRGARPAPLALGAVTLALAALAGGFLAGRETPRPATPTALTRFAFAPPAGWKLLAYRPSLAVSPDGRLVVFTAFDGKDRKALFVRELANLESRELPGTDGAHAPFFSPDGRAVAYFADGELRRVSLAGGPPTTIAPAIEEGGSWGEDGTIVFSAGRPASLFSVPATGGEPRRLTTPDPARGEVQHWWPQLLPGGDAVLFTTWSTTLADARVEWLSLRTRERRTVVVGGASARFAAGRLLWARPDGSVVVAPFDPRSARLLAAPTALVANVVPHLFYAFAQLAVGGDTLVYLPGSAKPIGQRRLARLDGDVEKPLATPARFYRNLKTGPDGRLAATLLANDRSDVWLVDPAAGALSRLTFDAFNIEPAWTADGSRVAYASNRLGPFNVFWRRSDGSAPAERLLASDHHQHPTSFSADGRELMIGDVAPDTGFDIWVVDLGTRRARPLLRTPANEIYAVWSRDSRWFVYTSDESGQWEVLARSYPDLGGRWQLSTDGGFDPFWSSNGRTVYFHRAGEVWAVDVAPEGRELHPAAARRVTRRDDLALASAAPGGGLYAILEQRPEGSEGSAPDVRVVVGWQTTVPAPG